MGRLGWSFLVNMKGWWWTFRWILYPQGTVQALYIGFLTAMYFLPLLCTVAWTHVPGTMVTLLPTLLPSIFFGLVKELGSYLAQGMFRLMLWRAGEGAREDPLANLSAASSAEETYALLSQMADAELDTAGMEAPKIQSCELAEAIAPVETKVQVEYRNLQQMEDGEAHQEQPAELAALRQRAEAVRQDCRLDWKLADMDGRRLRGMSDQQLQSFLIHVRFPFNQQICVIEKTKSFRNNDKFILDNDSKRTLLEWDPVTPAELEEILMKGGDDANTFVRLTGAPELAWREYFFFTVALTVFLPFSVLYFSRFVRGDGVTAALWGTFTERTTQKYMETVRDYMKKEMNTDVVTFFTKQLWAWI